MSNPKEMANLETVIERHKKLIKKTKNRINK